MNRCFDKIYLSWRVGKGSPRIMVGILEEKDSGVVFQYLKEGVERARQYGFRGYPGLALEQTVHEKNVLDLFSKRIINFERTDTKWLLEFWEVDQSLKEDTLYMLAMTQGKMQTDSFEFLASFIPDNGLSFVTDIAAITHYGFDLDTLRKGDFLTFKTEPDNPKDPKAVEVYFEDKKNELKEKQTSNWKKYLTFSFGNSKEKQEEKESQEKEKINPKEVLKLTEESLQKKYIMAECCHPIPGDDVLGYVDENDRIIIHKRQCPVAAKLKSSYGNRILATEWDTHKELSFLVYIYIKGIDNMGLLNEVTQVISRQLNVNIRKLTIETEDGIFEGKIQLWVHDVDDVKTICNNLKKIQNIKQVSRVEE